MGKLVTYTKDGYLKASDIDNLLSQLHDHYTKDFETLFEAARNAQERIAVLTARVNELETELKLTTEIRNNIQNAIIHNSI